MTEDNQTNSSEIANVTGFFDNFKNIAYDLRGTYAMLLLTPALVELREARKNEDFIKWVNILLYDLYPEVYQKLTIDEREQFTKAVEILIKIINYNEDIYKKKNLKDSGRISILKNSILNVELLLKDFMEKHGLYGTNRHLGDNLDVFR